MLADLLQARRGVNEEQWQRISSRAAKIALSPRSSPGQFLRAVTTLVEIEKVDLTAARLWLAGAMHRDTQANGNNAGTTAAECLLSDADLVEGLGRLLGPGLPGTPPALPGAAAHAARPGLAGTVDVHEDVA